VPNIRNAIFLAVFFAAATVISAQTSFSGIDRDVAKVLLNSDLKQAINEAESRSADDLHSLFWRLSLYRRAAHFEKVDATVDQILRAAESEKYPTSLFQQILHVIKDPSFTNTESLQRYLRSDFDSDVFGKLIDLCLQKRDKCAPAGFDAWLEKQAVGTGPSDVGQAPYGENGNWIERRIHWRERLGLGTGEILERLAEDVRERPGDLGAALRLVRFARNMQELTWLADNFSSESAYDHFELGKNLAADGCCTQISAEERAIVFQSAVRLLRRSLSLPFESKDVSRMYSYRLNHISVIPTIKHPEKQLRFWTKAELAEVYKKMGRPQDAQPIVEELMNTDTTDIISNKPSQLAGAVQAASGARVVESKILAEQATRQTSYQYWRERIEYYLGRKEPERVFEAYIRSLDIVPNDLDDNASRSQRLHHIRQFVDFSTRAHYYLNTSEVEGWGKSKERFRRTAETFLRDEFERTKSKTHYARDLVEIIDDGEFDSLLAKLLGSNSQLVINAAQADLLTAHSALVERFFAGDVVPRSKKGAVFMRLVKIAEQKDIQKALRLCEAISGLGSPSYAARLAPILQKNIKAAELRLGQLKADSDDYHELKDIEDKYAEILFSTYLESNKWISAEKLLMRRYSTIYSSPFERLALNAATNGAFTDAVRYWKMKANLDRRDLENLQSVAAYAPIVDALRDFYRQMKIDEPYSPVPDTALKILK
jgi:hypothetical protein